jgi:ABC-type branched-subunit amino acid transport system substrate-binding protein
MAVIMAGRLRMAGRVFFAAILVLSIGSRLFAEDAAPPIRLGLSAGFSGPTRDMAVELYRGAMACFARQNQSGGVARHPVELLAVDDGYEPTPAIENTVRFLVKDNVLTLFSALGSPTVSRVLPVIRAYADKGARLFFPVTGIEGSRVPPYVQLSYNLRASYRQEIEALVASFVARGFRRIAICHQADAFGRSGWDGAERALTRRGLSLCGEATFARTAGVDEDMTPQVKILAAASPQAILIIGAAPACTSLIRDLRRAGVGATLGMVSFTGGEVLLRQLNTEEQRLGCELETELVFSQVTPCWRDQSLPAAREYREALTLLGRGNPPPGGWDVDLPDGSAVGFEGYLNAKLLLTVLQAMPDPLERKDLDAAAKSIGHADIGIGVPVSLTGANHQGLATVYLTTANRGRLAPLGAGVVVDGD